MIDAFKDTLRINYLFIVNILLFEVKNKLIEQNSITIEVKKVKETKDIIYEILTENYKFIYLILRILSNFHF